MNKILLLPFLLLLLAVQSMAQPGALDPTFNSTGIIEKSLFKNLANETIYASVMQADGKLLVVGSQKVATVEEGFVARFLATGQLDVTFGKDGIFLAGNITTGIGVFVPNAIALDDLGAGNFEIVLAGYRIYSSKDACVVKLTQNGTHIETFASVGYYATPYVGFDAQFNTVQVHAATHSIIAAGTNSIGLSGGDYLVVSLTTLGVENYNNLIAVAGNTTANDEATCSVMYHADSVYVGGKSTNSLYSKQQFSIVAMNVITGVVKDALILNSSQLGVAIEFCSAIQVASDGKIVLAGRTFNGVVQTLVYRLNPNRTNDTSFDPLGWKIYDLAPGYSEYIYSMCLDPNNDIVLGGYGGVSGALWWKLCRIDHTTGIVDPNFYLRTLPTPQVAQNRGISGVHRLSNGKYVLVGENLNISTSKTDGLFKRVNSDGSDDSQNPFWVSDANTIFTDMAVASDGTIWACGNIEKSNVYTGQKAFIAHFNANGTLDNTFTDSDPETENGVKVILGTGTETAVYALKLLSNGKILVAGNTNPFGTQDFFVARLNSNGEVDITFSPALANGGYFQYDFGGGGDDVACDLALQSDGKIMVYGHGFNVSADRNIYSLIRLNSNGDFDNTFRASTSSKSYLYANSSLDADVDFYMNVRVDANDRIVLAGTDNASDDFFVVRLLSNGEDDVSFNAAAVAPAVPSVFLFDVQALSSDYATCIALKPDGKILVGGNADLGSKKYVMIQLNDNGTHDTNFGPAADNGRVIVTRGGTIEAFTAIHVQSSGAIVCAGISGSSGSYFEMTAHRFNAGGILDPSFGTGGSVTITPGQAYGSALTNNSLFVIGRRNRMPNPYLGLITKVQVVIPSGTITTKMALSNVNKTFGDTPFIMKASSNSPAAVSYSVFSGTCAAIDAATGQVTITCAGPVNTVTIRATQAAITGFTAASVDAVITIAKATPSISFKNQGALIGEVFSLETVTNTDATPVFVQSSGDTYLTVDQNGQAAVLAKGSATVAVSYAATDNYLPASAVAEITGYVYPVAPKVVDDEISLFFGSSADTFMDVLVNDTGYTGRIVAEFTDLDPATPGIQNSFRSPSLGYFVIDNSGVLTFVPFQGFIGTGEIAYTVQDSRGYVSLPGKIIVTVTSPYVIPALKATEMFTPNGDGLNDAFVIGFINPEKTNQLTVFDRNGGMLFSQTDYKNDWEGMLSNGTELSSDTYYFIFTEGSGADKRELSGFIEMKK